MMGLCDVLLTMASRLHVATKFLANPRSLMLRFARRNEVSSESALASYACGYTN